MRGCGFLIAGALALTTLLSFEEATRLSREMRGVRAENATLLSKIPKPEVPRSEGMVVTGYVREDGGKWADGRGSSLYPVGRGMVAADPSFFPPGTVLYIPNYGYGVVLDRGGAIRGRRLDLFFHKREEAVRWGRRKVKVWVIGKVRVSPCVGREVASE